MKNRNTKKYFAAMKGKQVLLLIFFTGMLGKAFAQPVADFSVNTTTSCGDLIAYFTDLSSGNPTSWFWDFGDGQTSTQKNPVIFYSTPGVYTVTLTVFNNAGQNSATKTNYITIYDAPVAAFSLSKQTGCTPVQIFFTDQSIPGGSPINSWSWDFGDGSNSTLQNPSHTYTTDGIYNVTLAIQSTEGCTDTFSLVNAVSVGAKPTPQFFTNQLDVCASSPVTFINKTIGATTSFFWDFGDGDTSVRKNPIHFFQDTGYLDIKLYAYNYGCVDSFIFNNYVHVRPPIVKVFYNYNCDSPYVRHFLGKYLGDQSFMWDFGDGVTNSTVRSPSHTYALPGVYTVRLFASSDSCDYEDSVLVYIIDEKPTFSFSNNNNSCVNTKVNFTASNYNPAYISTFEWDYGNGTMSGAGSSGNSSYIYTVAGTYYPKLIVRDVLGCYDTITNANSVRINGPQAGFSVQQYNCINAPVNFTDLSAGDGQNTITQWVWNYGDGTKPDTLAAGPFTHVYNTAGNFSIKLFVTDNNGCTDSAVLNNAVVTIPPPNAAVLIEDTVTCFPNGVTFTDVSQGQQLGRHWFFGDGDTSSLYTQTHYYQQPGSYPVTLIIGNQTGCSDTARATVRMVPVPQVALGADTVLCYGQNIVLQPTGASTYSWNPDVTLSCTSCQNPVAFPRSSQSYFVTGADVDGCTAKDSIYIEVKQPITLSVRKAMDTTCLGTPIQLVVSGAEIYTWQPSTGLNDATSPNPIANPTVTTNYMVIGTDNKNCFTDTAYASVFVAPKPDFNIIDTNVIVAAGSLYQIRTTSSPDVIKWSWSPPDDLQCTYCPQPQAKGDKIIEYTGVAYNQYGCSDTDRITIQGLCDSRIIFIPNTFSPNHDGINDYFYPRGEGLYLIKSMRIFSRVGQMVFQKLNFSASSYTQGWDGTINGKELPADVYVYVIEIICNNGSVVRFKGDIMLLK